MTKPPRPQRASKHPNKGPSRVKGTDKDKLPQRAHAGRDTIPVQAEWLEEDETETAPRVRPSFRLRSQAEPPPLPPLAAEYSEDAERAIQRLNALRPARGSDGPVDDLQRRMSQILGPIVKVARRQRNVVLEIATEALFTPRQADVSPAGRKALAEIARALSGLVTERVQVEGTAATVEEAEWALCASQLMAVARQLAAHGHVTGTISVVALGELRVEPSAEPGGIAIVVSTGKHV